MAGREKVDLSCLPRGGEGRKLSSTLLPLGRAHAAPADSPTAKDSWLSALISDLAWL